MCRNQVVYDNDGVCAYPFSCEVEIKLFADDKG